SIVKHLVEMHGGSIAVRSEGEGKGSTFSVSLPPSIAPAPESLAERLDDNPLQAQGVKTFPRLWGIKILAVDDEPDARELIERIFKDCGARVTTAASVDDALHALVAATP